MQGNHAGHQFIHIISFNIHALTGTHTTPHTHCKVSKGVHRGALRTGTSQEQAHLQIVCHALLQQCNLG
jgi:hypothetical protein